MQSQNINHPTASFPSEDKEKITEAEVYLSQGLFDEARKIYQSLLHRLGSASEKVSTDPAVQRSNEARRLFLREQLALLDRRESEFLGKSSEPEPEEPPAAPESEGAALFNRGLALMDIGIFSEAIREFERAAQQKYQPVDCTLQIGKAYIELGQYKEGLQILEKAYQGENLSAATRKRVLEQMALGYEAAADKTRALELYRQLAASDPHHGRAAEKIKGLTVEAQLIISILPSSTSKTGNS